MMPSDKETNDDNFTPHNDNDINTGCCSSSGGGSEESSSIASREDRQQKKNLDNHKNNNVGGEEEEEEENDDSQQQQQVQVLTNKNTTMSTLEKTDLINQRSCPYPLQITKKEKNDDDDDDSFTTTENIRRTVSAPMIEGIVIKSRTTMEQVATKSSSSSMMMMMPPPPMEGLDRQQAGLVRVYPGAYAITHPDALLNRRRHNDVDDVDDNNQAAAMAAMDSMSFDSMIMATEEQGSITADNNNNNNHNTDLVGSIVDGGGGGGDNNIMTVAVLDSAHLQQEYENRINEKAVLATVRPRKGQSPNTRRITTTAAIKVCKDCVDNDDDGKQQRRNKRRKMFLVCSTLVGSFIIIVLGVSLGLRNNKTNNDNDNNNNNNRLKAYSEYLKNIVRDISGERDLSQKDSPQSQALDWLVNNDTYFMKDDIQNNPNIVSVLIERYVLAVLYFSTGGPTHWNQQYQFLSNTSVCLWPSPRTRNTDEESNKDNSSAPIIAWIRPTLHGINCNRNNGQVTSIKFLGNNITGTLPTEISQLSELRILSLVMNSLSGTLPPEYSSLDHLTDLLLQENLLTGSFPDSYRNLGELKRIGLGNNKFTGTIPETYQDMTAIEAFYVRENQLTGSIPPTFFTELNQIVFFDVSLNLLEGNLPTFSSKNSRLEEFRCSNNKFYGKIPEMNFLTDLRTLDLSWNHFNGTMPGNSNEDLIDLKYLRINNNEFSGTIAANNSNHQGLLELNCANNSFTSLSGLGEAIFDLEALDLSSNHLSGTIAEGYGEFSKLTALNFASNLLSGTIPPTFEGLRHSLKYLSLYNTSITDGLEDIFCASNNSSSALITHIKADCLGDDPQIPCDCCTTCCNKGGDYCETNATKICQVNAADLESDPERGANCNCSQDGSRVDCVDTACKSCNIQNTSCAINKYGRTFNTATGFILNFYNNITYLTGEWTGIEIQYEANEASTTLDGDYDACSVSINGEACRSCNLSKCSGNNYGYIVDCSNLPDGYQYDACMSKYTNPGYLEIFDTSFESKVAGCRLLIPLIGDYKPT